MNHKLFCAIVIVFVELFATAQLSQAQIFGRRGCSSGYCAPVYHAPAVVQQRDIIQQIFFAAPAGYIAPVGETVIGLQRALELNAPDAKDFLNNSNNHISAASASSASARQVSSDILAVESLNAQERTIRAKSQGFVDGVRALAGESTSSDQPRAVLLTLRNGVYESVREIKPDAEQQPVPRAAAGGISCLKCHAVDGSAAAKFVIDDTFNFAKYQKAKAAVESGAMPPKSALSDSEKDAVVWQLGKLVP